MAEEIRLYDDDEFSDDDDFLENFSEDSEERFIYFDDDDLSDLTDLSDDEDLIIFRNFVQKEKDNKQISGLNLPSLTWCDFKPSEELPSFLNTEEFPSLTETQENNEEKNKEKNHPLLFSVKIRFIRDEGQFVRRKKMVLQIEPKKCPDNFRCQNSNCQYLHSPKTLCFSVTRGIPCVYGQRCNFFHPAAPEKVPLLPTPSDKVPLPTPSDKVPEARKHILCRKMFSVLKDRIQLMTCKFEKRCIFAHSLEELEENLHQCSRGCPKIKLSTRIIEKNGQFKKISRVENVNNENRCLRIHPSEKIKCYVRRMYLKE